MLTAKEARDITNSTMTNYPAYKERVYEINEGIARTANKGDDKIDYIIPTSEGTHKMILSLLSSEGYEVSASVYRGKAVLHISW